MNKYIKNILIKYLLILLILIIFFAVSIIFLVNDDYFKDIVNSCRVLVSQDLNNISKAYDLDDYSELKTNYTYTIVALDGKVIKSLEDEKIEKISLNQLSFDNWYDVNNKDLVRYSSPLIKNDEIKGIVIFTIPKSHIVKNREDRKDIYKYIATLLIFLGIIFTLYKIYRIINKDILGPINKMHKSAKEILKGNYLEQITYDYHGEIGEFSHDFERMRDWLMVSKEREESLKRSEKELLACVSHDFKTPLSNISGYCEGIIDGIVKEEKDIKRYAGIILKKSKVLTKLLDDILEFSKAEINKMNIQKKEIYSREFLEEIVEGISMDIITNGRKFIVKNEIPNLLINVDEGRIGQVINNIISNSIKYTRNSGIITIEFKKLYEGIEISISDDGVGIAAEEIPLVFNKFYRGEKHRNQNIPGSGLGLSIAKYIVEMHNGSIGIISYRDKGTTVILSIKN